MHAHCGTLTPAMKMWVTQLRGCRAGFQGLIAAVLTCTDVTSCVFERSSRVLLGYARGCNGSVLAAPAANCTQLGCNLLEGMPM